MIFTFKFLFQGELEESDFKRVISDLKSINGVSSVDVNREKKVFRIIATKNIEVEDVSQKMKTYRVTVSLLTSEKQEERKMHLSIDGMTCRSCEIIIEEKFKEIPGVTAVEVNATKQHASISYTGNAPSIKILQHVLGEEKYRIRIPGQEKPHESHRDISLTQRFGFFALAVLVVALFNRLGFGIKGISLDTVVTSGAAFMMGLVAATSSCVAVTSGLLISSVASYRQNEEAHPKARAYPTILFVGGRVISYTLFGGILGLMGSFIKISPFATGVLMIIVATVMLCMGLDMLGILPVSMKKAIPLMPKSISRGIVRTRNTRYPGIPFFMGAATFFLPCGFTQAFQLYALTTGSFWGGASLLAAFALGTAPSLFAIGLTLSSFKGRAKHYAFQFSGSLVVLLGAMNIQNGFTVIGHPLSLTSIRGLFVNEKSVGAIDTHVTYDGREQIMRMSVNTSGYTPNNFTVRVGVPTKWIVETQGAAGCLSVLTAPKLGIQKVLKTGENIIEFTPKEQGTIAFSCSMGMYRGNILVI